MNSNFILLEAWIITSISKKYYKKLDSIKQRTKSLGIIRRILIYIRKV